MKTILQWEIQAYNAPINSWKGDNAVHVTLFAADEDEAVEKAKKYFKREFYAVLNVEEVLVPENK
jgi:hypothetical protein